MTDRNHEQEHVQDSQNDGLDRALDFALTKYSSVEPRIGLEERILVNVRAERPDIVGHMSWRWGLAAALAAVLLMVIAQAWRADRSAHVPVGNHPSTTEQIRRPANPLTPTADERAIANAPTRGSHSAGAIAVRKPAPLTQAAAQADPTLDVFPSPQPLSEQELALARYVRNFPSDARLVAQAQEASEREVLARMQALANESTESN